MRSVKMVLVLAVAVAWAGAGCATSPPAHCLKGTAAANVELDKQHETRAAFTGPEPERGDKGPTPEGIEAIALLEKRMLEAHARDCPPAP